MRLATIRRKICVFGVAALAAWQWAAYAGSITNIIAEGATPQKLADGFTFTEGPARDAMGNIYFTDQPSDRILEWTTDGQLLTYMQPCGRANGLCFDGRGNLWACADEKNELWRIDRNGQKTVVLKDYQGKLLNGPNDIWITPHGDLFFTDPYYKRPWWKRGEKEMAECVYHLSADSKSLKRVIDDLQQPNGIIGTPDGKTLYIADIGASKTYRYRVGKDGTLTDKTLFCQMGSDGMTIDNRGNVYLTGKGVFVFDPAGNKIETIEIPEAWCGNVCFGGKSNNLLFITASKGVYGLEMNAHGVGSQ